MNSRYEEVVELLNNTPKYKPGMSMEERISFYEKLGSPCRDKKIIHVAGTNGKGSVCSFLRCILEDAGYHTATFISPHLIDIRERFLIDGEMIRQDELLGAYDEVCRVNREYGWSISFFDMLLYMFLVLGRVKKADVLILETGLGGRLDATNLLPRKDLCILTEIGLDHMAQLGNTIEEIAAEKAGILRKKTPVVYLANQPSSKVIEARADELFLTKEERFPVYEENLKNVQVADKTIDFSVSSVYYKFVSVRIYSSALYQMQNASLVVRGIDCLIAQGMNVPLMAIESGFARMQWMGRMQEALPGVFVDGAHNEDGIRGFVASIQALSEYRRGRKTLLFAVMSDKSYDKMLRVLKDSGLFDRVVFTNPNSQRAVGRDELVGAWPGSRYDADAVNAFATLLKEREADELIFVGGSLYLAGEILNWITGQKSYNFLYKVR